MTIEQQFERAKNILDIAVTLDYITLGSTIGMMIDTCAAKYNKPAAEIAKEICSVVAAVNEELGEYTLN